MALSLFEKFRIKPNPVVPKEIRGETGWSESNLYENVIPKYNPDDLVGRKGHKVYKKMMLDEQVKAVVKFKRDAITARDYMFKMEDGGDEKRVEIYEKMLDDMEGSFLDGLNFIMSAMYQGFSLTEKIIDVFDFQKKPYLGIRRMNLKPFDTFEFFVDRYGDILKIEQFIDGQRQSIDLGRYVYFIQNPEFDQHYGQSDLREAYRSWYSKDVIIRFYNQFLEKFSGGFLIAKPTDGQQITPGTPEYNALLAAMDTVQTKTSILLPGGIELDVQRPQTTDQFEKAIGLHDLQISKALLVPNLLGITPQGEQGSFAQSSNQLEAFLWTLDADALRLEDTINEQIFEPLNKLNFADGIGPKFRFKPVSESKKFEVIKTWKELVSVGGVEASETDEEHIRDLLRFPDKGEPLNLEEKGAPPDTERQGGQPRTPVGRARVDETIIGSPASVTPDVSFSRAEKRVKFNVILRKSKSIEDNSVERIESKIVDMLRELVSRVDSQKLGTPAGGLKNIPRTDFNGKEKTKVRKELDRALRDGWDLGKQHSLDELASARRETFKINMGRIDDQAADWLAANGFKIMGDMTEDMKSVVHTVLMNGVKFSWTTDEIISRIYDSLAQSGYISIDAAASETGRALDELDDALASITGGPHALRRAVRTSVFEAINEARYASFTDPELEGFVEALEYSAILDSRTTDICRHLDGRVYPDGAPEWEKYRPPNHFNCRSILVPVTVIDTDVLGKDREEGNRYSRPPQLEPKKGFGGAT